MTRRLGKLFATLVGTALIVVMGAQPASATVFPYRIDMQTCDVSGAGTDGYVAARIHGTAGSSGWIGLNNANHDDFERGNVDAFYFNLPSNIGTITSVYVNFVPTGDNSAWCLSWAKVHGPIGTSPRFYYNNSSLWFVSTGTWGPWLP
ncbi:hypothetical protein Rhe02_06780 [Rhizocola hellebori]|uniref:PLAT domain-containing protein n=2 Tax=Rhizocola hellebori TaxID=1392758 RepID=A0A8J3Q2T1_9ACTN|nr:hypothetical protein Rhe02_06780 [Rhizocola hellebori]